MGEHFTGHNNIKLTDVGVSTIVQLVELVENNHDLYRIKLHFSDEELRKVYLLEKEKNLSVGKMIIIARFYEYFLPENERDYDKAFYWFKKAAEHNNMIAQFGLGLCYLYGNGVEENAEKAVYYFSLSAKQGYPFAQGILGLLYQVGFGVSKDINKAIDLYQQASKGGDTAATYEFAMMYYYGNGLPQDYSKAVQILKPIAEKGYADAQSTLAYCYSKGLGVIKDMKKAFYWYEKAAEQGNMNAYYNLGVSYLNGEGVEKNTQKAKQYLKKAAELGDHTAQAILGIIYLKDEKNYQLALKWFKKSIETEPWGMYYLAEMYDQGLGVNKDYKEAYKLYTKVANLPNTIIAGINYSDIIENSQIKLKIYGSNRCNRCGSIYKLVEKKGLFKKYRQCINCGEKYKL